MYVSNREEKKEKTLKIYSHIPIKTSFVQS